MDHSPAVFPIPSDEEDRLACLGSYDVLGTAPEPEYDRIINLAADIFDVPICVISIIGAEEQWLKGRLGLDAEKTPRHVSFCTHTILTDEPLVILDASKDDRFRENPSVTEDPGMKFYAGAPLINSEGVRLGAFCVVDYVARPAFGELEQRLLAKFASIVSSILDARRTVRKDFAISSFAEATGLALLTADVSGNITFWNEAACHMFGYGRTEALGQPLDIIMPDRFRAGHRTKLARLAAGGTSSLSGKSVEVIAAHRDGHEFPAELAISIWQGRAGLEFGAHIQDITIRRAREAELHHLAHHDDMTGLLNRIGFRICIEEALRNDGAATVLLLDLDGFKSVNDTLGHSVGDALLQTVAVRMAARVQGGDTLGRIGGDEFALLVSSGGDLLAAGAMAQRLLDAFAEPFQVAGHDLQIGTSIGIAVAPLHASESDELLIRADLALLRAKNAGGRTYRVFDAGMGNQLAARRAFKDELRQACINHQWELFYQPQVCLANRRLIGTEALLRWRHPTRGLLLPGAFLPVLETHLLAYEVGSRVIDEACRQLAEWRDEGSEVDRVSVNLFAAQLRAGTLEAVVTNALERYGLEPSSLELEVTETIVLGHDDGTLDQLRKLYGIGVGISFDDFGTGFASLSSLKRFPLTKLKIDRSFVEDVCQEPHSMAIVRAVAAMGHCLGLKIIAEGIETPEQASAVAGLGCDEGQGYLYGRPMDALTFAAMYGEKQYRRLGR